MALIVAALGIASTVPLTITGIADSIRKLREPDFLSRIIELTSAQARVFVKNSSAREILITSLHCSLSFPLDSHKAAREQIALTYEAETPPAYLDLLAIEATKEFTVLYAVEPTVLSPGEGMVLTMPFNFSIVNEDSTAMLHLDNGYVRSGCILPVGLNSEFDESVVVIPDHLFFIGFGFPDLVSRTYADDEKLQSQALLESLVGYE